MYLADFAEDGLEFARIDLAAQTRNVQVVSRVRTTVATTKSEVRIITRAKEKKLDQAHPFCLSSPPPFLLGERERLDLRAPGDPPRRGGVPPPSRLPPAQPSSPPFMGVSISLGGDKKRASVVKKGKIWRRKKVGIVRRGSCPVHKVLVSRVFLFQPLWTKRRGRGSSRWLMTSAAARRERDGCDDVERMPRAIARLTVVVAHRSRTRSRRESECAGVVRV